MSSDVPVAHPAWGVCVGGFPPIDFSALPALGREIVIRTNARWIITEPTQGKFNWSAADQCLAQAEQYGIERLVLLCNAPAWAAPMPCAYPNNLDDFLNFVRAYATRFKGKVAAYEVWNEPQLNDLSVDQVKTMLIKTYPVIKAIDPAATVVGICMNGYPVKKAKYYADCNAYFDRLISDPQVQASMDVLSWHTYTRPKPPEVGADGGAVDQQMAASMALLKARGWNKPVWITEGNWTTSTGKLGVSERAQAQYLVRMAIMNRTHADRFYVYTLHNGNDIADDESNYGLMRFDNTKKPAFDAYRVLASIIDSRTVQLTKADIPSDLGVYAYRFIRKGGGLGYVYWTVAGSLPLTLTGLTPSVRRTTMLGSRAKLTTVNGKLNLVASPTPAYVETI